MRFKVRSRVWLALACVALVSACSAIKLGYNNSASIAHTYLTSKVDFDADQSALMKSSLRELVQWHRNAELPLLADELQIAKTTLATGNGPIKPVNAAQVQALNESIRESLRRTANTAAPVIAKNMLGLWPNQIADIQAALDDSNIKYKEERLAASEAERIEKSTERMTERFERWLGSLNAQQIARIKEWAKNDIQNPGERFKTRLDLQKKFMLLVEKSANKQIDQPALSQEISTLLNAWQTPASPTEKASFTTRQQATTRLVVDVLNMASSSQRNNAAERAASWAEDFQILASTK